MDHKNDPLEIAGWLANKNVESWGAWVSDPGAVLYVAEDGGEILGVGMINQMGEILLNYVNPDFRFQGVSKELLGWMEENASKSGITICSLESTITACQFYLSEGYQLVDSHAKASNVMTKKLI